MPALIEILKFVNLALDEYDFVPNDRQRVTAFSGSLTGRGDDRPRMGMHGYNPRRVLFNGLQVNHEGMFLAGGDSGYTLETAAAALIEERDAMLATILGSITAPPADTSLGTITVKMAGWTQTYSAPAQLASWSCELTKDAVRTSPYMLGWTLQTPYLLGDDDPSQYKIL